jgi:hypothetical protein
MEHFAIPDCNKQVVELQRQQQVLSEKLQKATYAMQPDGLENLRYQYDMTVAELLVIMGSNANCREVDTFAWSTFASLVMLRTGKPPEADYPLQIVQMMLRTHK